MRRRSALVMSGAALAVAATGADSLAGYRWRKRIVMAFAPARDDPRLAGQRGELQALTQGADERDVVLIEVRGDEVRPASAGSAQALRDRFGVGSRGFTALLLGKDGGVKLRSDEPITAARLASTIDAMPMRQDEMRAAKRR